MGIDNLIGSRIKTEDRTQKVILLAHGSGGTATHQLIDNLFIPHFKNSFLSELTDAALLPVRGDKILFTTDAYVVDPPFSRGVILANSLLMVRLMTWLFAVENPSI
jgi:hypothetical protein